MAISTPALGAFRYFMPWFMRTWASIAKRATAMKPNQPTLEPGTGFQYTSGCLLDAPHGTMEGTYQMQWQSGETFEAAIPAFSLAAPHALN